MSDVRGALVDFGDVVELHKERTSDPDADGFARYVGLEHLEPGDLRIQRWGDVADGTTFTSVFRPGHVLFGKRRAYQRKVAVADFTGVCSGDIYVLKPRSNSLIPEFLPFVCQTDAFLEHAVSTSAGSLSPRTNWRRLAEYRFALPSRQQQRALVDAFEAIDAYTASLSDALHHARSARVAYIERSVAEAPSAWLRDVESTLREPPRNGVSLRATDEERDLRTISISSVSDGRLVVEGNIKYVDADRDAVAPFFVEAGDVFVVRGNGNRRITGTAALSQKSYDNLFYPDLLIRLRFDEDLVLAAYAAAQWNSPSVHRALSAKAKSSNGIWKVNGADIRSHQLWVPPLDTQRQQLRVIEGINEGSDAIAARRAGLTAVRRSLLQHIEGLT